MSREIKSTGTFLKLQNRIQEYLFFFFSFGGGERFLLGVGEKRVSQPWLNPQVQNEPVHKRIDLCASLAMMLCHCELRICAQVSLPFYVCVHFPQTSIPVETSRDLQAIILVRRKVFPGVIVMSNITVEELRSRPGGKLGNYKNVLINQNSCSMNSQS